MKANLGLAACAAALFALACPAAEELGGTVMPYGMGSFHGDIDKIAELLRNVKERGGISRFTMCGPGHSVRVNGMMNVEGYAKLGRKIGELRDKVAADGIKIGYKMMPTMNCGINHPWRKFKFHDGKEREFTACFGDERFREDFAAKCAAIAGASKPFLYLMDDDFRYWGLGCFCDEHVRRFSEQTGVKRDRVALVKAIREDGAVRAAWHRMLTDDILLLAKAASDAIAAVSPETRVGLCAPGSFPELDTAAIARALAGKHRPVVRWWGSVYGYDFPVETSGILFSAQWAKENIPGDIECMYEADPCPHTRFYASAVRMEALISTTLAMGFSAPLFQALNGRADAFATSPDYIDMHKRCKDRLAAIKSEGAKGRLVGVQAFFDPATRVGGKGGDPKKPLDVAAWYRSLNRLGIPVTTAESPVKLFAGHHAFRTMDDAAITNLLSGVGMFFDGAAAEALTERGFAGLIGVKAKGRDKIDFSGEHLVTDGAPVSYPSAFHQNYGLDGCAVSRLEECGAECVTKFSGAGKRQPAITYFENALGGKVAVMAVNLADCKSPNFFSFTKRDLLVKLFRRMGGNGVVPVRVIDRANVMLLANDDSARLFLHLVNLSCDPADSFVFEAMPPYAGGAVEILDGATWRAADAKWDGNAVTVRPTSPVNVYGTLILRLNKREGDIVIYGSSPAAISAAVQAGRMGRSAVVVSPETRIGGLTTGGLGQTDIGNKSAFGGIALEFYRAVAEYYADQKHWTRQKPESYFPDGQCAGSKGKESMWTFEPSAALAILEGWERRDGLDIRRGEWLDRENGVVKEGGRIVAIKTLSGNVYRGKVFIDATYEGDLMAAAGVSYTVGREANSVYGETLNGNQPGQAKFHQLNVGVDPYIVQGDSKSGLLFGVEPYDPNFKEGDGDRRVQAYCFRMCLTDDPENRIPFKKPTGYDERDYELLFRHLAIAPLDRSGMPWINSKMPNRKTDTNNRTGFATDFIGQNWAWPEASYAEREKIRAAHLKYQQGLMWTLANHPRVPEKIRNEVSKWGTCKDEFKDGLGDGWQTQLYVREARRMVGEYVMTEHNCWGTKVATKPVAMGAYQMDSHHVRRYVGADGFVHNEGDVEVKIDAATGKRFKPYPIDYGAVLPKREECTNLIVPVCLSASHIAFGSIRMEPVFFALGQVAATAAAQALGNGCAVQDVDYAALRERLLRDGQVLAADSH